MLAGATGCGKSTQLPQLLLTLTITLTLTLALTLTLTLTLTLALTLTLTRQVDPDPAAAPQGGVPPRPLHPGATRHRTRYRTSYLELPRSLAEPYP